MFQDKELNTKSTHDLAEMGVEAIAYMREMTTEEIKSSFPETSELEDNQTYWALFGADGSPLVLAHERIDVASSAFYNNLKAVMPN